MILHLTRNRKWSMRHASIVALTAPVRTADALRAARLLHHASLRPGVSVGALLVSQRHTSRIGAGKALV